MIATRRWLTIAFLLGIAGVAQGATSGKLLILQANDIDPSAPTSQPTGRWYHWMGVDSAVTHLETAVAVDAGSFAGRGQRIDVRQPAKLAAAQVKIKRIGRPGPLLWQAGTAPGKDDLGNGQVPPEKFSVNYEQFVTLPLAASAPTAVYLRLSAASGRCPEDYYAVYCTWRENDPRKAKINCYTGPDELGMMYRALHSDPNGAALEADGTPIIQGASMMTRLLTRQPGPGRRQLLAGEEEPFQFVEKIARGDDPRRAGLPWRGLRPAPGEIVIGRDWRICVAAPRSPQVETAVADLAEFFQKSMKLSLPVVWDSSARPAAKTITLTQGKEVPDGPTVPAGYRYVAGAAGVRIHGCDPNGVLRGVWHLEELLMLRGGPMLKSDARTREPRYSPRATCAVWGGTGELCGPAPVYTDGHLSLISHYGYDAIWLNWYPGPERGRKPPTEIAPGQVPEGTTYQPFTPRLRDLVDRAERYGLEVVILYAAPHPANDQEREKLREEARQFLREFPKIRRIVLLDEGMGSVRKGRDAWVQTCSMLAQAFGEVRPDVRMVAWRYTFKTASPDRAAWDQALAQFCQLDSRLGFMCNFDSFWARRRDGQLQAAYDYCLSLKAPSEDYRHAVDYLVRESQQKGRPLRPIWTKIESRFSQEANTQPEIPCMQRWAERFAAVNKFEPRIEGMIANWYHQGFYPTPVTELFGWLAYSNPPSVEELLRAMACRDFGSGQEDLVVGAWRDFSEAIWHFPFYFGLSYPMNAGLAQPFWLDPKTVNPRPWRRGFINSLEQMDLGEKGARGSDGRENRTRLQEFHTLWDHGLATMRQAVAAAPASVRERAEDNWRTARTIGDKSAMTLRLARWFDARNRWQKATTPAEAQAALDELEKIGREELAATRAALPLYLCDSRMGHLNHGRGCFTAMSILDKVEALERVLKQDLPAARQRAQ
ncbi:MAG: hypothetical protein HZA91_03025 [Verrucomicrobia bacterium]|nr:hypothetical protein [Verrucomicrobiota bacterium]